MKTKILLFSFLALMSCHDDISNYKRPEPTVNGSIAELDSLSPFPNTRMQVYSYEGCEYIVVGNKNRSWGSHKGNCKNPIHKK